MNREIDNHVLADLLERGFTFMDFKPMSGSMLPGKYDHEYKDVLVYRSGSIANFREIAILGVYTEQLFDDEPVEVVSILEHDFAESGEWYVDHENLSFHMLPLNKLADLLHKKGIMNKAEREAWRKERETKLREAKAKREQAKQSTRVAIGIEVE